MRNQTLLLEFLIAEGGAGCRLLAEYLSKASRQLGRVPPTWRWLALDSDPRTRDLLQFPNGHFVLLKPFDGARIAQDINEGRLEHCLKFIGDPSMLKEARPGCQGQKTPRIGYYNAFFNASSWIPVLTSTMQDFLPLEASDLVSDATARGFVVDTSRLHVKSFAGLGGGQGGAIHRQLSLVARDFVNRQGIAPQSFFTVYGLLTNYSTGQIESARELANEGARLLELDCYQSSHDLEHEITFPDGTSAEFHGRLYDQTFLFEQAQAGKTAADELCEKVGQFAAVSSLGDEQSELLLSHVIGNELENTAPAKEGETGWISTGGSIEVVGDPALSEAIVERTASRFYANLLRLANPEHVDEYVESFLRSSLLGDITALCDRFSQAYHGGDVEGALRREVSRRLPRLGINDEALTNVSSITSEVIADWTFYGGASDTSQQHVRDVVESAFELLVKGIEDGIDANAVEVIRRLHTETATRQSAISQMIVESEAHQEAAHVAFADAEAEFQGTASPDAFYAAIEAEQRRAVASARILALQIVADLLRMAEESLAQRLPDFQRILQQYSFFKSEAERRFFTKHNQLTGQQSPSVTLVCSETLIERVYEKAIGENYAAVYWEVAKKLKIATPADFALRGWDHQADSQLRDVVARRVDDWMTGTNVAELFELSLPTPDAARAEIRRLIAVTEANLTVGDDYGKNIKIYGLITVAGESDLYDLLVDATKELRHWQVIKSDDETALRFYALRTGIAPRLAPVTQKALSALTGFSAEDRRLKLSEPGGEAWVLRTHYGHESQSRLSAAIAFKWAGALGLLGNNGDFTYKHEHGVSRLGRNPDTAIAYLNRTDRLLTSIDRAIELRLRGINDNQAFQSVGGFCAELTKHHEVDRSQFAEAVLRREISRWRGRNGSNRFNYRQRDGFNKNGGKHGTASFSAT